VFRTYLAQWLSLVLGVAVLGACAREHGGAHRAAAGDGAPSAGHATPSAGHGAADAGAPHLGGSAIALLEPTDAAAMSDNPPVSGKGTFTDTGMGVDLVIDTRGCELAKAYPVYIQQGTDCSDATLLGAHWDSPRGEGIGAIGCTGTTGVGRTYYSRPNSDKKPWTVGNPSTSDVLDHVLVVYDPTTLQPIACGQIVRADDVALGQPSSADAGVPTKIRAQLAGLCLGKMIVRDNAQECPNPDEVVKCASTHCELDACLATCSDYVACLKSDTTGDPCSAAFTCSVDEACSTCQSQVTNCLLGFCPDLVACAAPITPDGPCSQLEACCAMQGDSAATCLETVHVIEKFSGDPSCAGAMLDWDTTAHLPVPCKFK
jgi:hypothetical protein